MSDTAGTEGTQQPQGTENPEGQSAEETSETPTIESLQAKIEEITAQSRKWEGRAKENFEAKTELDKIRRENMTEAEKVQADLADANSRVEQAEARAQEAEAALARYKVATEFGLTAEDAEALSAITDEATLRSLAERLAGRSSGPRPNPAQGKRGATAPGTPAEAFADALSDLF
jgi:lysyl-tRNA synthetase class I